MKYWKKMLQIGAVFTVVAAAWLVWELHPAHHFGYKTYPVLAMPHEAYNVPEAEDPEVSATPSSASESQPSEAEAVPSATPEPAAAAEPEDPAVWPVEKDEKAFNVLLLGVDTDNEEAARTDVIVLAHVMPTLKKINVVSIPRDTRVKLAGIGETKINHAHALGHAKAGSKGGTEAAIQAVSNMLGVPIHYFAKMNFKGFKEFIDMIGGVDLAIEREMRIDNQLFLQAGKQHLDGEKALIFVRERYSLENGDFGRQADQILLMKAVLGQLLQPEKLVELPALIGKVKKDVVETNFSDADLISLAWLFKGFSFDDIAYVQIPGRSAMMDDPLMGMPLWYWVPDKEQVKKLVRQYVAS
ncbi:LCP family protein [Paenibacillus sp. MBLB4367]|uniref:LCP family protein n=1 Tax=Paenibacillus sp. MBLB4367 TaxID=3384767 RepID=UPI003908041E